MSTLSSEEWKNLKPSHTSTSLLLCQDDYEYLYKLVLVVISALFSQGKTHLLSRYMKGSLPKVVRRGHFVRCGGVGLLRGSCCHDWGGIRNSHGVHCANETSLTRPVCEVDTTLQVQLTTGSRVKAQIWDTAGQDPQSKRNAHSESWAVS
eukprot:1541103-Amphidinium_carterae.1